MTSGWLQSDAISDWSSAGHYVKESPPDHWAALPLAKVKGVEKVVAHPAQHSVEVQFATKGDVTTKQLIEALKTAGISATT